MDASGSWGCGAYLHGRWFLLPWDETWQHASIMAKELLPIVISTAIWGPSLSGHKVLYQWGNSNVVAAICRGSARYTIVMHLLHNPWLLLLTMMLILYVNILRGWSTPPQTTYPEITILCFVFFRRIQMPHCCQPHSQLHCYKSPTFKVQTGHQHTSVSYSFLPSTQSSSLHTQALWHRHPATALLLSKH